MKKKNKNNYLAIDPSIASTGYALFSGDTLVTYGIIPTSPKEPEEERLRVIALHIQSLVKEYCPSALYIEGQYLDMGKLGNSTLKVVSVRGVVTGVCLSLVSDIDIKIIHPKTVKSYLHLHPRTKRKEAKEASIAYVEKKYKQITKVTDDISDAIIIGEVGREKSIAS